MITLEELRTMSAKNFSDVKEEEIISCDAGIWPDAGKSSEERILEFLSSGKNPYFKRTGNVVVKIGFENNGMSFCDVVASALAGI